MGRFPEQNRNEAVWWKSMRLNRVPWYSGRGAVIPENPIPRLQIRASTPSSALGHEEGVGHAL